MIDFASAQAAHGLGAVVRIAQHWGFRFLVSFVIATAVIGYLLARSGRQAATLLSHWVPQILHRHVPSLSHRVETMYRSLAATNVSAE